MVSKIQVEELEPVANVCNQILREIWRNESASLAHVIMENMKGYAEQKLSSIPSINPKRFEPSICLVKKLQALAWLATHNYVNYQRKSLSEN